MNKKILPSPLTSRLLQEMGEKIKLARLRRRISVRSMAERAGVAINTILSLEKGHAGVSIGVMANVLHVLGLSDDITQIAHDDVLGRKLQDLELLPRKRAPKT